MAGQEIKTSVDVYDVVHEVTKGQKMLYRVQQPPFSRASIFETQSSRAHGKEVQGCRT